MNTEKSSEYGKRKEELTKEEKIRIARALLSPDNAKKSRSEILKCITPRITVKTLEELYKDEEFRKIYLRILTEETIFELGQILRDNLYQFKSGDVKALLTLLNLLEKIRPPEEDKIEVVWEEPLWLKKFRDYHEKLKKELEDASKDKV